MTTATAEIEIDGHRIAYEMAGAGPPLVLLHGWPTNGREWRRQLDGLCDEFTVVAWDAPGAGRSSDPSHEFRLSDWADVLADFIDALELRQPCIAGLSWGGGLALELYRRHPDVPRSLILVSAYAGWAGSLAPDVVRERLELMLHNTELPFASWPEGYFTTLVAPDAPADVREEVRSVVSEPAPDAPPWRSWRTSATTSTTPG